MKVVERATNRWNGRVVWMPTDLELVERAAKPVDRRRAISAWTISLAIRGS